LSQYYVSWSKLRNRIGKEQKVLIKRQALLNSIIEKIKIAEGEVLDQTLEFVSEKANEYIEKILNPEYVVKISSFKRASNTSFTDMSSKRQREFRQCH
jgi:phosphoribosylaminoimidazole-succinocarboxamide synthase